MLKQIITIIKFKRKTKIKSNKYLLLLSAKLNKHHALKNHNSKL